MNRVRAARGDDGVALVMALVFMLVVGLFVGAALQKAQSTSASGQQVLVRGQLQYALDGGIDVALQALQQELSNGAPTRCVDAAAAPGVGSLTLNAQSVTHTCTTLAGRAAVAGDVTTTNYAIVVTSPNADALTTQSGASSSLGIDGSVFLNGTVTNGALKKQLDLTSGDLVSPVSRAGCAADLAALTDITLTGSGQLKTCTEQTLAQAVPTLTLPAAPVEVATALKSGVQLGTCRVFFPGRYSTSPPAVSGADTYFVSGLYYFHNIGQWSIDDKNLDLTGGHRTVSTDSAVPANGCTSMTDATALAAPLAVANAGTIGTPYANGVTWAFGGTSSLDFKKGSVTLFSPPAIGTAQPVNIYAVPTTGNGYTAITSVGAAVITGGSNLSAMLFNAKILAPTGTVSIFSTNNTVATARGGIVAYQLDLQASASGSGGLVITAPGGIVDAPPPFRTVRIVTQDSSGGNSATNTAVATISNFAPFTIHVLSWRTG